VAQATNALLFIRMVIARLIERLGSEELQAFAAAPHGFLLEAANEELVAGGRETVVMSYRLGSQLSRRRLEPSFGGVPLASRTCR
jgi:hypothetical protein